MKRKRKHTTRETHTHKYNWAPLFSLFLRRSYLEPHTKINNLGRLLRKEMLTNNVKITNG
jgi:hypothetical protein